MYILIDKKTNKVTFKGDKKPISYSDNLILAEVDSIPEKCDYLIAENIMEVTSSYFDTVEETNDNNEVISKLVERYRTYTTCNLKAEFSKLSFQASNPIKEIERSNKIVNLIRKKYSIDEELAILRQKESKPEKYFEYYNYVEECVKTVPKDN
jgi:hypothetical protein